MRASWNDVNGRKIAITNVHEIREFCQDNEDKISFSAPFDSIPMKVYVDNFQVLETHRIYEVCRFIDSQIVLSADKEIG